MTNPVKLDGYSSRKRFYSKLYGPDSVLPASPVAIIFTVAMSMVDFATNYSLWNLVLEAQPILLYMITFGTAVLLDFPMSFAAVALKQYRQNRRDRMEMALINALCILSFAVVFILTTIVRVNGRDLCFEFIEDTRMRLLVAIAVSVLPAATSLAVYAVTYASSDPKRENIRKLSTLNCAAEARRIDIEKAEAEAQDSSEENSAEAFDTALRDAQLATIDGQALSAKQLAATEVMTHIGADPDQITTITAHCNDLVNEAKGTA